MNHLYIPSWSTYGQYKSELANSRTRIMTLGDLSLYYSYDTIVAFKNSQEGLVVCENEWGPTTGKHLNWIDDGKHENRVSLAEFKKRLGKATDGVFGPIDK